MLGENIKNLRKQKGYSQETLAQQLSVVRQTVSKWEKGYSVPDAEMLERMAALFEVPVTELLGHSTQEQISPSETKEIVNQLAILNEQLALQNRNRRRIIKTILIALVGVPLVLMVLYLALIITFSAVRSSTSGPISRVEMRCTLNEEEYYYGIEYDNQYQIISAGGDAWIANHVQVEQYGDANVLMAQIEDYFIDRGGTFEIIKQGTVEENGEVAIQKIVEPQEAVIE
ncbi:MAG: helix-turn-helix transcriptional regulator [Lachnospiraceae bacterium]|nr:helix-turn-helix transcriptional regulator [Lachnospiraceae bacterium]